MGTLMVAWETAIALSHFHVCSPFATKVVTKSFPDTARVYDDTFPFFSPRRPRARALPNTSIWWRNCPFWSKEMHGLVYVSLLYLPLPSLMRKEKNAFTFHLNTTESVLFWHFISTIYSTLSGWRMHIAWLGSMPGKLNRHKSCTPVSCDKPRWYQCTW